MKFYPSDWRADPALRMCSVGARGLWMEMLCIMHEAEPYGSLRVNGRAVTDQQLAALAGSSVKEVSTWLSELDTAGVFSRDDEGAIISRRMQRDKAKADADKSNGRRGGNPKLRMGVNPHDNPPVGEGDKAQKPEARSQKETTPSGVVSAAPPTGDLDHLSTKLLDAVGDGNIQPHGCIDLSAILGLLAAGVDLETDILPTIRARAAKLRRPVGSWAYFTEAIRDAYNRRIEAGQGLSQPKKVAPIKPDADMSPDELRAAWRKRLNYGRAYRSWPEFWGPMPGQPGCTAPPDMLEPKDGQHPDGSPWDIQRIEAA